MKHYALLAVVLTGLSGCVAYPVHDRDHDGRGWDQGREHRDERWGDRDHDRDRDQRPCDPRYYNCGPR